MDNKDKFYVGIPTKNMQSIAPSLVKVIYTSFVMQKEPSITFSDSSTVCMARSSILREIGEKSKRRYVRMLWLDSDIFIDNEPQDLAQILLEADENDMNIVGFYNLADSRGSITGMDKSNIDKNKFRDIQQHERLSFAGLGFYYGIADTSYRFHEEINAGEDYFFFMDNNIDVRIEKRIILHHAKYLFI